MKTKIISALLSLLILSACEKSPATQTDDQSANPQSETPLSETVEEEMSPLPADITNKVIEEIEFPSPVFKKKSDVSVYYDINDRDLEDASFVVCGSGAYPDEIAVFKFKYGAKAAEAKAALNKRLADQTALYESYTPDEIYKLQNAFVIIESKYAILCAVADNDKAKSIIDTFF